MTAHQFPRGFKTNAERLCEETRGELGVSMTDRLDPRQLAAHFAIPIVVLGDLRGDGAKPKCLKRFQEDGNFELSAFTVFDGYRRQIVVNDMHTPERQANSLAHELSHVILEHTPHPPIIDASRHLDAAMEAEADWLGGVLLVPRAAALHAVRQRLSIPEAAAFYGVSVELMRWRHNHSGVARQALHEKAKAKGR